MALRTQNAASDAERVMVVLTTWPSDRDPIAMARPLVEERLAACVNVLPAIQSLYRWEGAVQQDSEQLFLIKTTATRLQQLYERLRELHPYDVPEFLVFDPHAGAVPYLDWVIGSTSES
jgi:periplasmic divalent cation tolerance protein